MKKPYSIIGSKLMLNKIKFFFSITVINPRSYGCDGYTAFEDKVDILGHHHSSSETTITPTPYTSPVRIDPTVLLLQNSMAKNVSIFRAIFTVGNEAIFDQFRITHSVTAIVSSISTVPIFRYISKSMLLPLKADPRPSIHA